LGVIAAHAVSHESMKVARSQRPSGCRAAHAAPAQCTLLLDPPRASFSPKSLVNAR